MTWGSTFVKSLEWLREASYVIRIKKEINHTSSGWDAVLWPPGGCCAQQPSRASEEKPLFHLLLDELYIEKMQDYGYICVCVCGHFVWCEFCAEQDILPDIWTLSLMSLFHLFMDYSAMDWSPGTGHWAGTSITDVSHEGHYWCRCGKIDSEPDQHQLAQTWQWRK